MPARNHEPGRSMKGSISDRPSSLSVSIALSTPSPTYEPFAQYVRGRMAQLMFHIFGGSMALCAIERSSIAAPPAGPGVRLVG